MTDLAFTPETRMLVDGELIHADSGKTFDNINPANAEVIGVVADASASEMLRAIAAARRAFDHTDWSTDKELRKRCLQQLHDAIVAEKEEMRHELIAEVGTPITDTYMAQLDGPLADGLLYSMRMIDQFEWERDGIARRIRTGSFAVNGGSWYTADMPYGGYKTSGVGRQNGIEGFEQYLETKIVAWPAR